MSAPRNSKTWVTISREMVGSTTSPMSKTNPCRATGCLEEVLVKNAPSSSPSFSPPSQTKTTLSWIGNVALVRSSLPCFHVFVNYVFVSFLMGSFPIHFLILTFFHFIFLGGSIIACRSIQHYIVALESDIDVFKSILLSIHEPEQEYTSQQAAQRGSIFAPPPRKMAKRNFDLLCA